VKKLESPFYDNSHREIRNFGERSSTIEELSSLIAMKIIIQKEETAMTNNIRKRHVSFDEGPPQLHILDRIVDDESTKSELFYQKEDFRRFSRMYHEEKLSKKISPSRKHHILNVFWNTTVDHHAIHNDNNTNSRYYGDSNNVFFSSSSTAAANDSLSTIIDNGGAVYAWV